MLSLLWVDDSRLGEALLFLVFSVICYFHQIVMISVINYVELLVWLTCTVLMFSVYFLCVRLWSECCDFGLIWFYHLVDSILGMDDHCFFWYHFFFSLLRLFLFIRMPFYIARHLAAKLGTNLAVLI